MIVSRKTFLTELNNTAKMRTYDYADEVVFPVVMDNIYDATNRILGEMKTVRKDDYKRQTASSTLRAMLIRNTIRLLEANLEHELV